jgi:hypothetical protein
MIRLTEVASQRPLRAVFTPRLLSASAIPLYVLIPAALIDSMIGITLAAKRSATAL